MRKMKNEENEKTILYKQYQQNENEVQSVDQDTEEDNLEAEERKKNIIVYGMMGALGLLIIFLLARNIYNKDTARVIYKDAGNSNRVIKTSTEQIINTENGQNTEEYIVDNESGTSDLYGVDGNMSETMDLYEIAVENGFTGTREEFYELINNWNYSYEELERNLEKLQELIRQVEDGADGEDGKDGADGDDGRDGKDGKDGKDGYDGKDGINGQDGQTTYIAYADDVNGKNFSLTPTETSKYVGTCITTQSTQPTNPAQYSNWQEYRSYVITATTDPDSGVTTVHIN